MATKRQMRGPAARRRLAVLWLASGLTAREYAAAHGLAPSSLQRWGHELRAAGSPGVGPGRFMELPAVLPPRATPVRVTLGGVTLEFDHLPPVEYIAALGKAAC